MKKNQKSKSKNQKVRKSPARPASGRRPKRRRTLKNPKTIARKRIRKPAQHRAKKIVRKKTTRMKPKIVIPQEISFEANEFPYYHKTQSWFVIVCILAILIIILSYIYHEWLLIVVVVLAAVVMFQNARKRPKKTLGKITNTEIQFKDQTYQLSAFRSFWIVPEKNECQLFLRPIQRFSSYLHIQVPNEIALAIHAKLLSIMPEERAVGDEIMSKIYGWFRF